MGTDYLHIFAKAPVPGQVKTRLIPSMGEEEATSLYKQMLRYMCKLALPDVQKQLWVAGDRDNPFMQDLCNEFSMDICGQIGGDLGQRMLEATLNSFTQGAGKVVIIGADCVSVDEVYLQAAFAALDEFDVVVGPAEDGGYVLIGFSGIRHQVFNHVQWGGENVCQQTCDNLQNSGLSYTLLDTKWDVDSPEDVEKLRNTGIMSAL